MKCSAIFRSMLIGFLLIAVPEWAVAEELLKTQDISTIMQQIFAQQGDRKRITETILKQAFKVYIDQFDPDRIYLLEDEVKPYLDMTDAQLAAIAAQYKQNNYDAFRNLNSLIQKSIVRARMLRKEIERDPASLFQGSRKNRNDEWGGSDLGFAQNTGVLKSRLRSSLEAFINAERRHFGDRVVLQNQAQSIALYEKNMRDREDRYLYRNEKGAYLPAAQQENLFALHVLKALASSLDAHTAFYSQSEAFDMRVHLENEFQGVGINIQQAPDGSIIVGSLAPGSPAAKSGLVKPGDVLLKIDGKLAANEPFEKVMEMLRGKAGSEITLALRRNEGLGEPAKDFNVTLKRAEIVVNQDRVEVHAVPYDNGIIGIITLHSFYQGDNGITSENDVRNAIEQLQKQGNLRGLILDLRENSGGFLNQAVKVTGLFISDGIVVIARYFNGEERIYRDMDADEAYNGPLVVLTSKATASAAEIVAQALQDYGVALIVGDPRTYGKGTIQSQTVTENNAASFFKVTVGKYYTVSGKTPQIQGVKADIVVPGPFNYEHLGEKYLDSTLPPDSIAPEYNDPLADVSPKQKEWYLHYYVPTIQRKESEWRSMLPILRKDSAYRIAHNQAYQAYLKKLQGVNDGSGIFYASQSDGSPFPGDFQLDEAINIVKEMINLEPQARNYQMTDK